MSNTTEMAEHNRAYEQLVSGDDDLIGLIAYSLYKKDKRDFYIKGWTEQHGGPPQADHVRAFSATVLTLGSSSRYRTAARDMIDAYAKTVADAEKPLDRERCGHRALRGGRAQGGGVGSGWYRQIPAGIVAGIVLAVVLVLLVGVFGYAEIGPISHFERTTGELAVRWNQQQPDADQRATRPDRERTVGHQLATRRSRIRRVLGVFTTARLLRFSAPELARGEGH